MQDRRGFLKGVVGLVGFSVVGCDMEFDSSQETVLDHLLRLEDDVVYEVRQIGVAQKVYVTSINGSAENTESKLYWLFTVDGKFVNAAVNEIRVGRESTVKWQLMRPRDIT